MKKKWENFYRNTKEEMLQVVGNSNLLTAYQMITDGSETKAEQQYLVKSILNKEELMSFIGENIESVVPLTDIV